MTKWKRNNYKFWHSPIALVIFFCLLLFFGYKIIDLIEKNRETAHTKELILDKIDALQKRQSALVNDISKLETLEGKEEIIRGKYQVVKEGEKMVTIVDDKGNTSSIEEVKVSHGFWNWIKNLFNK